MTKTPIRVLCIDDEPLICATITDYLGDQGMEVRTALDGQQGVERLLSEEFDAVLLDLRMPGRDGLDVLEVAASSRPETPVIVVSATSDIRDAVEALRRGAWDFINKPLIDLAVLDHALGKCLERARLLGENRQYRQKLEALVRERTRELTQANEALKLEIAERLTAEEALRGSLKEKEVLLKEIHHRVKNNLQIVSSLLSLQALKCGDPRLADHLAESQSRVQAMAMAHERLYRSPDLAGIDFSQYISQLVDSLLSTHTAPGLTITPRLVCQAASLPVDKAIPCGLIVNELVANCLKHAFKGRTQGLVEISLETRDDTVEITVRDDGVGLPEGFALDKANTLGLQLVVNLARQLGGDLSIRNRNGAMFTIAFTVSD